MGQMPGLNTGNQSQMPGLGHNGMTTAQLA